MFRPAPLERSSASSPRARKNLVRASLLAIVASVAFGACDQASMPTAAVTPDAKLAAIRQDPGTRPMGFAQSRSVLPNTPLYAAMIASGLQRKVTLTGRITQSIDGLGTNNATGTISILKPAGATVRAAYLAAASTGFGSRTLVNNDVTIDGVGVTFTEVVPSAISSSNGFADVTSLVTTKLNAAPAGLVDFTIGEVSSGGIDGEVLAVIFNDPAQTTNNTVVILFGAQQTTGDDFTVTLSQPVNTADPGLKIDMSLGISYSAQPGGQVSLVDVNGNRLTSSAGGQDDGELANGALLTVGGVGDTNANPSPSAGATDTRTDDELYNIVPFVPNASSSILVHSSNPSGDDNIFFASFFLNVAANVNCEVVAPTVAVSGVITGPPKQIQFAVQDASSGLQSIVVTRSDNAVTVVPPFTIGTTSPVTVTATKTNQSLSSVVGLTATDVCGNVTVFDPFDILLGKPSGGKNIVPSTADAVKSFTATGIIDLEHFVSIYNDTPGLKSLTLRLNGVKFEFTNLRDGENRLRIDVGSAIVPGNNNTFEFEAKGKAGATATVLVGQ